MLTRVPFTVETKRALIEGAVYVHAYAGCPASYDHPGDPAEFEIDDVFVHYVEFDNCDYFEGAAVNRQWIKEFILSRLDKDRVFEDAAEILAEVDLPY